MNIQAQGPNQSCALWSGTSLFKTLLKSKNKNIVLITLWNHVKVLIRRISLKYIQRIPHFITKTCLYNFDPLKPHFYIVKLGFTGVHIIFLIFVQNKDCGYTLEPPRRGGSNEYPQSMFWAEIWKILEFFLSEKFRYLEVKIFYIFE